MHQGRPRETVSLVLPSFFIFSACESYTTVHSAAILSSVSQKHQQSLSTVFANKVYFQGVGGGILNPIITFLLSFCAPAILEGFWKGPFIDQEPFYLVLKGFRPATAQWLRMGWLKLSLANTITRGGSGPGLQLIQATFDGQPAP